MWTVIAMHLKVVASFVCDTKTTTRADVEAIVRLLFFFFFSGSGTTLFGLAISLAAEFQNLQFGFS